MGATTKYVERNQSPAKLKQKHQRSFHSKNSKSIVDDHSSFNKMDSNVVTGNSTIEPSSLSFSNDEIISPYCTPPQSPPPRPRPRTRISSAKQNKGKNIPPGKMYIITCFCRFSSLRISVSVIRNLVLKATIH